MTTEILVENDELTLIRRSSTGDIHVVTAPLADVRSVLPADKTVSVVVRPDAEKFQDFIKAEIEKRLAGLPDPEFLAH